jgi:DNA-binding transcriptional ArsR family regulator
MRTVPSRLLAACHIAYFYLSGIIIDARQRPRYVPGMKLDDAAARLEALGNPTRLRVYRALVRAGEPGMAVGKLQTRLSVAASTLSHHIKTMVIVGLVTQERHATTLICRANYPVMRGLVDFLVDECCADANADCQVTQRSGDAA